MKILINHDPQKPRHSANWTTGWEKYCKTNGLDYEVLDLMQTDAIETLKVRGFDVVLWHFGNYSYEEMLEARSILYSASKMGLKTFPNFNEAWHFDDKIAEMYALQAVNALMPKSFVFYNMNTLKEATSTREITFPIVAKLRNGSGSHNVKLIKSKSQLFKYAKKMLIGGGYNPAPSLTYKASSNLRSSHDWATFKSKVKRIPEFLRTLRGAKEFPHEKRYVYLQEFIPNDNFDMKVVVVNGKCSGFCRPVRSHDFRASGGGEVYNDNSKLTRDVVASAFYAAEKLNLRCVGFDYVIDKRTGTPKIVEMSYGFMSSALTNVGGYYDRDFHWHEGGIVVEDEIIKSLIKEINDEK